MLVFRRWTANGYTLYMDSVRFGRALGIGARAAAKTLVTAADAVAAPNPSAKTKPKPTAEASSKSTENRAASSGIAVSRMGQQAARTAAQAIHTKDSLKQGGKRFGQAVWGPVVKLSGVLWLEVTGVFFGIFALFAVGGAWKLRGEMHRTVLNQAGHEQFIGAVAMAVLFGYFCVSSFVKANRRGSGR